MISFNPRSTALPQDDAEASPRSVKIAIWVVRLCFAFGAEQQRQLRGFAGGRLTFGQKRIQLVGSH